MALDYTVLQAVTQEYIEPKLQDNIYNKTPVLKRLRTKVNKSQDGGEYIKVPIIYAEITSAGHYSGWSTLLTADNDTITAVRYDWGHVYANMAISQTDELKNSGKAQIISLLTAKAQQAEMQLSKTLTTDLFSTSSVTNGIQGFPLMVDDSASTDYAGINATDFSNWAASVDTSTNVLSLAALQNKFGDCSDGNEVPTLIISNQACFDAYWLLLEVKPEFRVQSENNSLKFQGADWIVDKACPGSGNGTTDNHIYFINENFITFYVHPRNNFRVSEWLKPINQQGRIARITFSGQLATNNRRRHGAFKNIDPAL
ncbi:MAG: phage major capsid protein [Candidatus Heimdallarchaeaceae archaeon]